MSLGPLIKPATHSLYLHKAFFEIWQSLSFIFVSPHTRDEVELGAGVFLRASVGQSLGHFLKEQ